MIIDKIEYKEMIGNIIKYSKEKVDNKELAIFKSHVENKLKNFKPTIMVYGTYNSGKSTLLNALFGENEIAKTGDAPETEKIHKYQYKGFTIYDTPGINAPIEHERVTSEHLKKCEVVLFVLSNDGPLEEKYVYTKISDIVKENKPLLIVLNNKKNIDLESNEAIKDIKKVNINLTKIGKKSGIKNIEDKVSLVMIDVLTALEGKVENEKELIEESNIIELESDIVNILNKTGHTEVINTLNIYIRKFVENTISLIDENTDNSELQKAEEILIFLEKYKNKSEIELKNIIDRKMNILDSVLREKFLDQSVEDDIHQYLNSFLDTLISQLESKFESISSEITRKIEQFSKEIDAIHVDQEKITIKANKNTEENSSIILEDTLKKTLRNKDLIENTTKEMLLKLREYKILFKGKWEKTLGKYSGRFAITVNAIVGAYEIYQAVISHQKEVEAQKKHVLSAKNKSAEITEHLKVDLFKNVDDIISEIFNSLINNLKKDSMDLKRTNKNCVEKKQKLKETLSFINTTNFPPSNQSFV